MTQRTDIDTFEKLADASRSIMANGLIQGKAFGAIIIEIMHLASAYGADEAARSPHFFASVQETDFEELKADQVLRMTQMLFETGKLDQIIQQTLLAAAAFGFQSQRRKAA